MLCSYHSRRLNNKITNNTTFFLLYVQRLLEFNEIRMHLQVHSTSKKLLYQLDHLVQVCNQPPPPGVPDHRKHVSY